MNKMLLLKRLPTWRSRFCEEIDRQRREPFVWGKHDCAIGLIAGAIKSLTGVDVAKSYVDKYTTEADAFTFLKSCGVETLSDFVAMQLPEIHPSRARVGDIGIIPADGSLKEALCVFDTGTVIVMTEEGHGRRARKDVTRAFKVG